MKVFWFDTETSGLDSAKHGIIQLAYAVEIDGEVVAEGELFSNCEGKVIEDGALKVNGFTREQIATFNPPSWMYRHLGDLFDQYVDKFDRSDKFYAGGYNVASFDMAFLRQLWTDCHDTYFGSWFHFGAVDPSGLIPALNYAGFDIHPASFKLTDVAAYLGIDITGAHDAQSDIRMTREVMKKLVEKIRRVEG